jgi:error-prone DNA polymerase
MLLVRGILRRTGAKGVSLRATGAWELSRLWEAWRRGGLEAVQAALSEADEDGADQGVAAGGTGVTRRRMLVHASGFKQSPYADVKPAGGDVRDSRRLPREGHAAHLEDAPTRKLWHSSPGSSGH